MNFSVYFIKDDGRGFNPQIIYEKVYEKIKLNYPLHSFKHIDPSTLRNPIIESDNWIGPCNVNGELFLRIENDDNNKYFLVSYWDINKNIFNKELNSGFLIENLVELFTSIGIQKNDDEKYEYCDPPIQYTPISYSHTLIEIENEIKKLNYRKIIKTIPNIPKFRGFCYAFRTYLLNDKRFEVINTTDNRLCEKDYLAEINSHRVNISFNGVGETSHRDIDILGLGNVLLRAKMITNFHNPLIPEYHYASVDIPDHSKFKDVADAFLEKYNQIKNNKDYLNFIAANGRRWYLENGTAEKNAEIIFNKINLDKLK